MLTVTDAALQHLQSSLARVDTVEESSCFRLTRQQGDTLGLVIQSPESGDRTFECEGDTVLAASENLAEILSGRVLDIDDKGHLVLVPKAA
jgi:hypothetical protein